MGQFIGGISLGLIYNWKFALVLLSTMPVIAIAGVFLFTVESRVENAKKKSYSAAHAIAEEVLTGKDQFHSKSSFENPLRHQNCYFIQQAATRTRSLF